MRSGSRGCCWTSPSGTAEVTGNTVIIALPLTQEELASLVSASRATVTRAFSNWRRRGVVQTGQHLVTITDPAALRQIAAAGR